MAPSVPANEVDFYTEENYKGDKFAYQLGADENLWPGDLNDKFQSVAIGVGAKLLAWQHADSSGHYAELETSQPSLAFIEGLSRFKVIANDTRVLAFRFVDTTGGYPGQFRLTIDAKDVGQKVLHSEDNDKPGDEVYYLVGLLPENAQVTTAVYLHDEKASHDYAPGSIYFQWSDADGKVDITENSQFPKQLTHEPTGTSKFLVKVVSTDD